MSVLLNEDAIKRKNIIKLGENLKASIVKHLYDSNKNQWNYLVDHTGKVDTSQEGMGISFATIFEVLPVEQAKELVGNAHTSSYGIPSIYPDFPRYSTDTPGRHNNIVWPVVNGFYAKAAIVTGNAVKFSEELKALAHLAMDENKGNGDFKEIYNPYTGKPDGGWQSNQLTKSCNLQTWSATAYIDMVLHGVVGLRFDNAEKLVFKPYLPSGIGKITITGLKYRNQNLDITLIGKGSKVKSFMVNGKAQHTYSISRISKGKQNIVITLT